MEILLKGGVVMICTALVMAWLGTFARWFPIRGVDGVLIKDYALLVKAHIDFILMSLFCFAFFGVAKSAGIELPITACWLVVIGGMTNPGVFVIAMLKPDFWQHLWAKVYAGLSFVITTIGFVWENYISSILINSRNMKISSRNSKEKICNKYNFVSWSL